MTEPAGDTPEPSAAPESGADLLGPDGKVDLDRLRAATTDENAGDEESIRRVSFTLARDLRKRVDQYVTDRVPFLSRSRAQKLIAAGAVTVAGKPCKPSTILREADTVEIVLPSVAPSKLEPQPIPLDALYEDDRLIVLNKQPGVLVHPARSHPSGTLINGLAWRFEHGPDADAALSTVGAEDARPGVVHRLDRDTSGVIVFAKDDEAHWRLARQFEARRVEKRYVAVVEGAVDPPAGVIDLPIGPHPSRAKGRREKQVVRHDSFGKPSVTLYRTLERFDGFSLLELELRTGRTHQIRVHLAHLGFSIAGDDMYGGRALTRREIAPSHEDPDHVILDRQALHAALLAFEHPITRAPMSFTARLHEDMADLIRLLRAHRPGAGPVDVQGARVNLDDLLG